MLLELRLEVGRSRSSSFFPGIELVMQRKKLKTGPDYVDEGLPFANSFGAPIDLPNLTRRHFKPILEAAELPHMRVYDLRHTSATLLLAAVEHPTIVSERLGHSTVMLTLDT